ncbi:MAG TPA: LacI family DNA-binding transcriptional regulator [Spirochaetia bacterium]|jgi:LacI family transcriptional regulator|nr:LacI family DNA-binding transcriptional regulator [Spirochaetia bacterium]
MARITLKEVADRAGVTPATVSMILNGKNSFKDATVQKVRRALEDLHYVPNLTAKRLATQRTETVAFVLENIESAFEIELLKGIQGRAVHSGYDILFLSLWTHQKPYVDLITGLLQNGKADGIISVDQPLPPEVEDRLTRSNLPFVFLENDASGLDSVVSDNFAGGVLAARHFLDRGVRRPALVHGPLNAGWMAQRVGGFVTTLEAGGVEVPDGARIEVEYRGDQVLCGQELAPRLLDGGRSRFDAVFVAAGDEFAMGLLHALQRRGLRVPQDLRVLGYDGLPACQLVYPSLSTVDQDIQELGALAFSRVLEALAGPAEGERVPDRRVLKPNLVLRESSP